jgi:hypothetical protein
VPFLDYTTWKIRVIYGTNTIEAIHVKTPLF